MCWTMKNKWLKNRCTYSAGNDHDLGNMLYSLANILSIRFKFLASRSFLHISLMPGKWLIFYNEKHRKIVNNNCAKWQTKYDFLIVFLLLSTVTMYRVGQKTDHFQKCITPVYDDIGRRSIYQNERHGDIRTISLTPDKELNITIYWTPSYQWCSTRVRQCTRVGLESIFLRTRTRVLL